MCVPTILCFLILTELTPILMTSSALTLCVSSIVLCPLISLSSSCLFSTSFFLSILSLCPAPARLPLFLLHYCVVSTRSCAPFLYLQVLPVETGYRVAMEYNLVWSALAPGALGPSVPAADPHVSIGRIADAFRAWDLPPEGLFVIPLDHLYSEQGLVGRGLAALKGEDGRLGRQLLAASAALPEELRVQFSIVQWMKKKLPDLNNLAKDPVTVVTSSVGKWYTAAGKSFAMPSLTLRLPGARLSTKLARTDAIPNPNRLSFWGGRERDPVVDYTGNEGEKGLGPHVCDWTPL